MKDKAAVKALKFSIGNIVEDESIPSLFLKKKTLLRPLLIAIDKVAANQKNYDIILIRIKSLESVGWAILENIRRALLKLNETKTIAYLDSGGMKEYYIASVCNEIFLAPSATLNLIGIQAEVFFLKDGLDSLGINADVISTGDYKTFADMFTRNKMSTAHKEMLETILKSYLTEIEKGISLTRASLIKPFKELINEGPFTANEALDNMLVDRLIYQEDIDDAIKERFNKKKVKTIPLPYSQKKKCIFKARQRIAIIYAQGNIVESSSKQEQQKYNTITKGQFLKDLKNAGNNKKIKAIVIRINSPGGSALTSDIIWNSIKKTKEKKPIIVSMSNVAASGGYYIAVAADHIFAENMTLTGSIGVILGKIYASKLLDKLSIKRDTVSIGTNSDIYSPINPFTKKQREKLTKQTFDFYYKAFLLKVSLGRNKTLEETKEIAQGRVWTGDDALINGLIDKKGGFLEAIDEARERAKISKDDRVYYHIFPKRRLSLSSLLSNNFDSRYKEIVELIDNYKYFSKAHCLYMLPFSIKIGNFRI